MIVNIVASSLLVILSLEQFSVVLKGSAVTPGKKLKSLIVFLNRSKASLLICFLHEKIMFNYQPLEYCTCMARKVCKTENNTAS